MNTNIYYNIMKKFTKLAYVGAIALLSIGFSACSSSDDVAEVNPTYDGNAVKTSFTISIGDVKGNPTRMSADAVQKDETFKGMTDIYLFPFKTEIGNDAVTSESYINLPDFSSFSTEIAAAQGKIYKDVSLSVGVKNFLFYAAIANDKKDNGQLKPSYLKLAHDGFQWAEDWDPTPILTDSKVNSITFDLVPIQKGNTLGFIQDEGKTTIDPLNAVDIVIADQITAAAGKNDIVAQLTKLQRVFRNDYGSENTEGVWTSNYKPYAGSSPSMLQLMTSLYNSVNNMTKVLTYPGDESGEAINYGKPILDKIDNYFNKTSDATGEYTLSWKNDPEFPKKLELPDGAVALKWTGNDTKNPFQYIDASSEGLSTSVENYTYPARLYYTVKTPAMVKNEEYLSGLTNTITTWDAIKTGGVYSETAISATTRSVIMKDQVQYAVGRLDVAVRVKPSTTIKDSGSGSDDPNNAYKNAQPVTIPANGYTLTGVLIGGQKQVGWDFTPISTATSMTIWDGSMTTYDDDNDGTKEPIVAKQQAAYSNINSTLALETAAKETVRIALEFTNEGNDFYGIDHNLIPAGTKFYLVAELKPSNDDEEKTNAVTGENNPDNLNQVFKQDYITTANLTIGETSLQNAYNVIPDLRSPKLEFGLSVDLKWKKGITFETEFNGGN